MRGAKQPGRYFDGQGLFLLVEPTGAKRWKQRLTAGGHRQELGLGPYPVVTLAVAGEAALTNRREIRNGENPKTNRRRARGVPTFAEAERKVFALRRGGWKGASHAKDWAESMRLHVLPRLGAISVADISTEDVIAVLSPIWHSKPTTAKRVRQQIAAVLTWAVAQGLRSDNPADSARAVLARPPNGKTAQRSLPYAEVAGAVAAVRAAHATPALKLAFEFMVLTTARSGEVREATWGEIDLKTRTWSDSGRTHEGRPHRVQFSDRALKVLTEARKLGDGRGFTFRIAAGQPAIRGSCKPCGGSASIPRCTASGFGRRSERTSRAKSGRRPLRIPSKTRRRRPMREVTCSRSAAR